jgi:hypothetical protein
MAQKKTPKQAAARVAVLLRGIDNSVSVIEKQKGKIDSSLREARHLMVGLSNAVVSAQEDVAKARKEVKEATKKAAKKPAKKPAAKTAKKPAAKTAKTAKKPGKKPAAKKPAAKAAKKASPKNGKSKPLKERLPPKADRPLLKNAIRDLLKDSGPMKMADIYNGVVEKWGYWSRQSFYNVIRDEKNFKTTDGETYDFIVQDAPVTDREADAFVASVANTTEIGQAVSSVQ